MQSFKLVCKVFYCMVPLIKASLITTTTNFFKFRYFDNIRLDTQNFHYKWLNVAVVRGFMAPMLTGRNRIMVVCWIPIYGKTQHTWCQVFLFLNIYTLQILFLFVFEVFWVFNKSLICIFSGKQLCWLHSHIGFFLLL